MEGLDSGLALCMDSMWVRVHGQLCLGLAECHLVSLCCVEASWARVA